MAQYILLNPELFLLGSNKSDKVYLFTNNFLPRKVFCRKPKAAIYQHILTFFSCMLLRIVKLQKQKNTFIKTGLTYLYTRGNKI